MKNEQQQNRIEKNKWKPFRFT